ncbi:UDP-N-acetylmuramoyl-tripeptide--D-alanyl-D-alanine ligase [uncultured Fusobacterium sp.]|uniref:UDP-N-acetylmuramoyl-tripeptide--D-alanyl-D- alanine ligase n=1 Tax=uncultured Fusobacterium sp. TaxID=159267 RepID=UPI002638238A|nr:UDP-N-acetylmuramoyl-tripeptide--D-alanyl-D-alanine ligase [uncultured Fusobacterium sp.]
MKILTEILQQKYNLLNLKEIANVVMDSRKVKENSLFFAINNGNNYIDEVLEKGATLVIADNYLGSDKRVIKVEDTIVAMQELARDYRMALKPVIIGITGSNGKTTTKDMVYSVLSQKYRCKKTEGNYNNHIGLPFTILQLEDGDEIAVLEMGMSGFGEIDKLCEISSPDYGIITNIGDSHLEFLKTRENVFKAKGEMIKYISEENLIVYGDDFYLRNLVGLTVGFGDNCKEQIRDFQDMESGLEFMLDGENYHVGLNGKHNCLNAAMSVVIGKKLKIDSSLIQKGFQNLELTPMRFQKIEKDSIIYINDAYNASPISMNYSLETFDKLYNEREKIVVLGDMLELGENEIEYHKQVLEKALSIRVDKIYIYGERMKKAQSLLENSDKIEHFQDKKRISEKIKKSPLERKAVLLKGSRGMKMEEIIEG